MFSWFMRVLRGLRSEWPAVVLACFSALSVCASKWLFVNEYRPPVGVYIAIMGLVAALMSLRKEPSHWEKASWIILMTVLIVAEIQNLYKADREQARTFNEISQSLGASKNGLDATAGGIRSATEQAQKQFDTTMDRVNRTLKASEEAKRNTQRFADLELDGINPSLFLPQLNPNTGVSFNVFYKNIGSDLAEDVALDCKDYLGPLDDEAFEKTIVMDFDKWWPTVGHRNAGPIGPGQPRGFSTFNTHIFTVSDVQSILGHTNTIYLLTRWTYRDKNGRWFGDNCMAYQDPTHDLVVGHSCKLHNNHRYRAPS